jgi:hypothetical protein
LFFALRIEDKRKAKLVTNNRRTLLFDFSNLW